MRFSIVAATLGCVPFFAATAQELPGLRPDPDIEYSPYLQENYPNQVFFGDTHLHTSFSADAGLVGATTTPDDAFRFAKGEVVIPRMASPHVFSGRSTGWW
jgi:hypothetical protein